MLEGRNSFLVMLGGSPSLHTQPLASSWAKSCMYPTEREKTGFVWGPAPEPCAAEVDEELPPEESEVPLKLGTLH
jgi:hypothetical protein